MNIIYNNNLNSLITSVNNIFIDIKADKSKAINYLNYIAVVIFTDNTYFVYEPFECFEVMDKYYNIFNNKEIKHIIIDNTEHIITDMNINHPIIINLANYDSHLQIYMWEFVNSLGYTDIDFEERDD